MNTDNARESIEELKRISISKVSSTQTLTAHSSAMTSQSITLEEFYTQYYLPFIQTSKKSYKQDINYYKNHILPLWANTPMNQITRVEITSKHIELKQKNNLSSSTANKLIKYLSYTYNLAISWSIPFVEVNPTQHIKLFKEDNIIERYLSKEEISLILKIASKIDNPFILQVIQLLLLTGVRKAEALHAKWEDIDLINNILTLPITKSGKVRRIPISPRLKKVIESIPRYNTPYVFPSLRSYKPMQNFEYHWYKIRKEANLEDVRIHDLRHTFASTLVNEGVSLYEVQKLLGHSSITVTQRYAHLSNESLQSAVDCVGWLVE